MPTYDYKCDACGHTFEKFHSMTAAPIRKCPKCGKNRVKRLLGIGAGLIFKGSGFYITDYRSEGYKSAAKAESGGGDAQKSDSASTAKPTDKSAKPAATKAASGSTSSHSKPPASKSPSEK